MPTLYLARHGQDEDNANGILNGRRDTPLTDIGIEQARTLAQHITSNNLPIKKVYSSPLQRAYQTAETVTEALGIARPEKIDLLIERDFGTMTGKSVRDIEKLCSPDILKSDTVIYFLSPEGAETFPQLLARAESMLHFLERQSDNEGVLMVCHGDIGKMIYAAYYHLGWKESLLKLHFGNSEIILLAENSKPEERHIHKIEQHNY
jgi:probable phosphoglycerate mutase